MAYQCQPFQALMVSFKLIGIRKVNSKKEEDSCSNYSLG